MDIKNMIVIFILQIDWNLYWVMFYYIGVLYFI